VHLATELARFICAQSAFKGFRGARRDIKGRRALRTEATIGASALGKADNPYGPTPGIIKVETD
jgi:hypothetical protein